MSNTTTSDLRVTIVESAQHDTSGRNVGFDTLDGSRAYQVKIGDDYLGTYYADEIPGLTENRPGEIYVSLREGGE